MKGNLFYYFIIFCASVSSVQISNGILTIGIDTTHGGAISTLIDNNVPNDNLINCHDQGREVQQSYYAGPDPYLGARWSGNPWPWNPISSGDAFGHPSKVLDINSTATSIYVKAQPLQWALENTPCECTFETKIMLEGNGAFVRNRLVNFRGDHSNYGAYNQELPALYTIGQFDQLWE
jgi:hypothetical protein